MLKNKFFLTIEKYIGAFLINILGITYRYKILSPPPEQRVIFAFWHRNILPLAYLHKKQNIVIMVSSSKDGELIAGPVSKLGFITVRGSSTRQGATATKKMIKLSEKYSLAITPDGPKGEKEKIKKGLLYLAYFTGLPIIPVAVDVDKAIIFNSWDSFRLPKIGAKIFVSYGNPIWIKTKDEIALKYDEVQKAMDDLTKKINNRGEI
jgi:lysophospholipid acyltransferase (LPLAT)-like uncharacterized protein